MSSTPSHARDRMLRSIDMRTLRRREALTLGGLGLLGMAAGTEPVRNPRRFRLAFGSCNRPSAAQPLWEPIRALRPDAWLWLGDIVYADTHDVARTRKLYAKQAAQPGYAELARTTPTLGIWDDHDFGENDAGAEYPERVASQSALLDFLREPADSPRRRQKGTYESYVFGGDGESVKLILLDARYHREPPGARADTLGKEQWAWLEHELLGSRSRVNLIASGYQVLPVDHSDEKWGNFPAARRRLLGLVDRVKTGSVVFLSGDRHFAELSRVAGRRGHVYELTSSGLTHSYENVQERNRLRVGEPFRKRNFGVVHVDFETQELVLEARGIGGVTALRERVPMRRRA